jgi:hypothetical protein
MSLSLALSLPEHSKKSSVVWAMLLSDVFHHVAEAIADQTARSKAEVSSVLENCFREVIDSDRGIRTGVVRPFWERSPALDAPEVDAESDSVEKVRILFLPDSIRVLVRVGMWLPNDEEAVWGNILYDLASLIAEQISTGDDASRLRTGLFNDTLGYVHKPSTTYTGTYY